MEKVRFDCTHDEMEKVMKIIERMMECGTEEKDPLRMSMDIVATHMNGCPLDLDKLLSSPDPDFLHDVFGIKHHINRKTGKLEDCFVPRCAR